MHDVETAREWARREAAKLPAMTADQARSAALLARRIDARLAETAPASTPLDNPGTPAV